MERFCPTPELNASPRINTTRRTSTPGDRLKAKVTQAVWGDMKGYGVSKKPVKQNESLRSGIEEDLMRIQRISPRASVGGSTALAKRSLEFYVPAACRIHPRALESDSGGFAIII